LFKTIIEHNQFDNETSS